MNTRLRMGYGVGAVPGALANTVMIFFFAKFLVDDVGIEPLVAGGLLFAGKLWDAVTDPVVGRLSDATTHPWGPRRTWIAGGLVPLAVTFVLLWQVWPVQGWTAVALYGALYLAFSTAYTCVVVPYGAMTPSLTSDYDERTRLNGSRMAWGMIGGIVSAVLMPLLARKFGSYSVSAVVIASFMIPAAGVLLWATRGRDRALPIPETRTSMWSVFKNAAFRRVAVLFLAAWCNVSLLGALLPFYVQDVLLAPDYEDGIFAALQLSALISIPFVLWMTARLDKHRAYAVIMVAWSLVVLAMSWSPTSFVGLAFFWAALAGPSVAGAHVLPWAMLPDVVEADRVETGVERAGAFYGVMTFLEKLGSALALQGMMIGLQLAGYDRDLEAQSALTQNIILWMLGPIPAVVLFAAALFALRYPPVRREEHRQRLMALESSES